MRIIVPISTRGRPLRLAGVLHSLTTLQSGKHEVTYVVGIDGDDIETLSVLPHLEASYPCEVVRRPRPTTLGQAWNELVLERKWDTCVVVADKHLCLTQDWDDVIAEGFGPKYHLALGRWHLLRAPEETLLIMSRKWYETTGQIFPEWFPFWFSERWVFEVHQLAFNVDIPLILDLKMQEPAGKTHGLRDLEFWFDFFAKTRDLRIWEASCIAKAWKRKMPNTKPILQKMQEADEWQKPRIPLYYESRGGVQTDATPEYLKAKAKAEKWLADNSGKTFMMETIGAA